MNKTIINRAALCVTCLTIIAGCGKEKKVVEQPVIPPPPPSAQDNLNSALLALNPNYNGRAKTGKNRDGVISAIDLSECGVTNISPLAGLPLTGLDISKNDITDLSPLAGMQIPQLFLENTLVEDRSMTI